MKIAINGQIIDTNNICRIDIIETGYWQGNEDGDWFIVTPKIEKCKTCRFKIRMINKNKLTVETYISKLEELKQLRESIIIAWSENQSTIPQFNLK
jgi:hypothetical protein